MKLSQFNFNLPQKLIAEYPSPERDESRLMVVDRKTGKIEHHVFKDILNYFDDRDAIVVNNTKVFLRGCSAEKKKQELKLKSSC